MRRNQFIRYKGWLGKKASIKSLKRYCDEIWSELVRTRDNHECVICKESKYIQAHHLITRKYLQTRFNINCGISLCSGCHSFRLVSAHNSPWVIYSWLEKNKPEQYNWFIENRYGFNPKKSDLNISDYREILYYLLAEFEKISPRTKTTQRFYRYTESEEKSICDDYLNKLLSRRDLSLKYGYSEQLINDILKRNNIKMRIPGNRSKQFHELKDDLNKT